ncbi:hypothetical protein [Paracoccus fontiphilus]|uniref:Uncharacterized protein n=1 Tax=Paracoccus fontiphilus TaxID=1815556 RepID=A0ABV7IBC3_9RHOB|nr:hypothetical protein [Paracoccus fontiphilus]
MKRLPTRSPAPLRACCDFRSKVLQFSQLYQTLDQIRRCAIVTKEAASSRATMAQGSAPGERRGGRQAGTPNRRTAALREAIEAEGVDPAVALVRIAKAAEAREDFGLAVEAYGKVLPLIHAKPRPAVLDPDETIAFERDLFRMKVEETAKAVQADEGLASRLARAKARKLAEDVAEVFDAMTDAAHAGPIVNVTPSRPAASAGPSLRPAPAPAVEAPQVAYRPVLPRSAMPAPIGDWSMRERQAFADEGRSSYDTDPYSADPLGFLANRDC